MLDSSFGLSARSIIDDSAIKYRVGVFKGACLCLEVQLQEWRE